MFFLQLHALFSDFKSSQDSSLASSQCNLIVVSSFDMKTVCRNTSVCYRNFPFSENDESPHRESWGQRPHVRMQMSRTNSEFLREGTGLSQLHAPSRAPYKLVARPPVPLLFPPVLPPVSPPTSSAHERGAVFHTS